MAPRSMGVMSIISTSPETSRRRPERTRPEPMTALDQLEPIETASKDELAALQLRRLKDTLRLAHDRVPHYRKKFDTAGVHPDDLKAPSDIAKFPFTIKDDLRENYPFGMFAVPMQDIVRVHASSGTTGMPVGGGFTERQVQLITDFQPDIIMVTPSYMMAIADEFERQGLKPSDCSLRIGIFGAEPWTDSLRAEIERRMGIHALDLYGLSEVIGPGVAAECIETKDGLTIWEDHFYPEIIDPETGNVLPDGETGELVITSLTKEGMPVIRYRTRDLTRLLPGTARTMRRIARIKGRSDDMLIIRGVNVFPSQIEAVLMREELIAPHYVLEIRREGPLDTLDVLVESRPTLTLTLDENAALARRAEQLIKGFVGVTATVRVVAPGTIERSQGKAKRVIDRRPKS